MGPPPPPRPPRVGGAPNPGDDDPDDDESYYRAPRPIGDPPRRPMPNPYGPPEPPNAEQWAEVLGRTMARGSRRQAQPPPKFENKATQDVRVWTMTCEDFFERNAWQWEEEEERIKYALSMMDGNAVTPFAITYRKKMTGEFGFPKHDGYDLSINFKAQLHDKFSIMHRAQRALRDMEKVQYEGDIEKYLLTLENLNIDAEMTGVAWRHMIEKRLPIEARRRWAHKKFDLDSQFIETVRNCTKAEESFKEQLGLEKSTEHPKQRKWGKSEPNKSNIAFKDNRTKPAWNKVRKNYSPQEKKVYAENKAQVAKGNNFGETRHTDWAAAHKDIKPEMRQQRGRAGQCTRCGMNNYTWKQCRRDAVVSTITQKKPFLPQKRGFSGFRSNRPQVSRTLRIQPAPQQVNQIVRPKAWEMEMDES